MYRANEPSESETRPTEVSPMPMQYLHTMVRISDVDASLKFYCDLLGMKEVRRYYS